MTPHHLHALAAAWSLQAARERLTRLADDEAAQIAAEQLEAPALLRSPVWGSRHTLGGHGDPTAGRLATANRLPRLNRWAVLLDRADRRIAGLAAMTKLTGDPDPLARLTAGIPALLPGTAALVARHLQDEDGWIREAIGVAPVRAPLIGVTCPACDQRGLYVQAEGPEEAWMVVCPGRWDNGVHNPCLCIGAPDTRLPDAEREPGCPCGMQRRVEGVAHIWPRAAVLGAVAGAAPTQPTN